MSDKLVCMEAVADEHEQTTSEKACARVESWAEFEQRCMGLARPVLEAIEASHQAATDALMQEWIESVS